MQCLIISILGLTGISTSLSIGCFVPGSDIQISLTIYLIAWNIVTFIAYALDKAIASDKLSLGGDGWRFSECGLHLLNIFGGPLGAWVAMYVCRHKIGPLKRRFQLCCVAASVFNVTWVFLVLIVTAKDTLSKCNK